MCAGSCQNCRPKLSTAVSRDRGLSWSLLGTVDASNKDGTWVSSPALVQVSHSLPEESR